MRGRLHRNPDVLRQQQVLRFRGALPQGGHHGTDHPGIKPISTPKHLEILPRTFSVSLPEELVKAVRACGEDTQAAREVGIEWAIHQAKELKAAGVPIIHFYTMGRTDNIRKIACNVF